MIGSAPRSRLRPDRQDEFGGRLEACYLLCRNVMMRMETHSHDSPSSFGGIAKRQLGAQVFCSAAASVMDRPVAECSGLLRKIEQCTVCHIADKTDSML